MGNECNAAAWIAAMTDVRQVREKLQDVLNDVDVGIAIAAVAQMVRLLYAHVDKNAPHLSQHIRDDFERISKGIRKSVN